jgi:hypothetical protein
MYAIRKEKEERVAVKMNRSLAGSRWICFFDKEYAPNITKNFVVPLKKDVIIISKFLEKIRVFMHLR